MYGYHIKEKISILVPSFYLQAKSNHGSDIFWLAIIFWRPELKRPSAENINIINSSNNSSNKWILPPTYQHHLTLTTTPPSSSYHHRHQFFLQPLSDSNAVRFLTYHNLEKQQQGLANCSVILLQALHSQLSNWCSCSVDTSLVKFRTSLLCINIIPLGAFL